MHACVSDGIIEQCPIIKVLIFLTSINAYYRTFLLFGCGRHTRTFWKVKLIERLMRWCHLRLQCPLKQVLPEDVYKQNIKLQLMLNLKCRGQNGLMGTVGERERRRVATFVQGSNNKKFPIQSETNTTFKSRATGRMWFRINYQSRRATAHHCLVYVKLSWYLVLQQLTEQSCVFICTWNEKVKWNKLTSQMSRKTEQLDFNAKTKSARKMCIGTRSVL